MFCLVRLLPFSRSRIYSVLKWQVTRFIQRSLAEKASADIKRQHRTQAVTQDGFQKKACTVLLHARLGSAGGKRAVPLPRFCVSVCLCPSDPSGWVWASSCQDQGPAPYAEALTSVFVAIADIVQAILSECRWAIAS